ncbi:hypothetical protein AAY473_007984, partial [Plecturocebus cupreus]
MDESGNHHSQQTDTRTENQTPYVITHRNQTLVKCKMKELLLIIWNDRTTNHKIYLDYSSNDGTEAGARKLSNNLTLLPRLESSEVFLAHCNFCYLDS